MKPGTRMMMRLCAWFAMGLCVMVVVLWSASTGDRVYLWPDTSACSQHVVSHEYVLANHSFYILDAADPAAWMVGEYEPGKTRVDNCSDEPFQMWGGVVTRRTNGANPCTAVQIPLWAIVCGLACAIGLLWWQSRPIGVRDWQTPMLPSRRAKVAFVLFVLMLGVWTGSFFGNIRSCLFKWDSSVAGQVHGLWLGLGQQSLYISKSQVYASWQWKPFPFLSSREYDVGVELPHFVGIGAASPGGPGWDLVLPMWTLTLLSALLAMFFCWRDQCTKWSQCRKCRYDLMGNTSGACPECGTKVPEKLVAWLKTGDAR